MIGNFTLQQLKDGCRLGMLDSWGTTKFYPDYKTTFEDQKEELEYVIIKQRDYDNINAKFLHIKRPEIKTTNKDYIPYSTRLINLCDEEIFAIQQLDFDKMTTKVVGNKDQIKIIKGFIKEQNTFSNLNDNEMWERHYKELEQYRDIPGLSNYKMSNLVKGNLNPTPERLDEQRLHVTQIDDYDNYQYIIYGISHLDYVRIHNSFLQEKKTEDIGIYFEEKLDNWKDCIEQNSNRIVRIIQTKPSFVKELKEYSFQDGSKLFEENILTDLCDKHHISWKGGWATWKFLNINDLEYFIVNEDYKKGDDTLPYLFK